ncbi:hypothetical protein J5226_18665 [Lysobacter sp. K5869]|uniref:prealbumin-like fold domain-containing protein n=1 Tax=Lysobacter sp. K5869 TaxID=2820808 RepID=UPI001C0633F2|nr:DUF11 domain-containing protein [Lysobacter sp. K5869]QWP75616.1 hypothetical protein J5226_18665 [Lysobacter sp. K5869]
MSIFARDSGAWPGVCPEKFAGTGLKARLGIGLRLTWSFVVSGLIRSVESMRKSYGVLGLRACAALLLMCVVGHASAQEPTCSQGATVSGTFVAGWFHNNPAQGRGQDGYWPNAPAGSLIYGPPTADAAVVSAAGPEVVGSGLVASATNGTSSWGTRFIYQAASGTLRNSTFADAVANNRFLTYSFTTPADLSPRTFFKRTGFGGWGLERWQYTVQVSTVADFSSNVTTITNAATVNGGGALDRYAFVATDTGAFPFLRANTTYFIRVYLFNQTQDPYPGNPPFAAAFFDDFQIGTGTCPLPTLTVTKLSNGGTGTFSFTGTNGFSAQNITTATAGTAVTAATQRLGATNTATTLTETLPPTGFVLSGIRCTGLPSGTPTYSVNGASGGSVVLPSSAMTATADIACTFTNTLTAPVTLRKAWVNGKANDAVSLSIAGGSGATTGSSVAGGASTNATATANVGATVTLTEAFTTGVAGNYTTTIECADANNSAVTVSGTGMSRTITVPSTAVTCTYTNSRIAQQLNLAKRWEPGAVDGHTASATTTGGTANPAFSSTAPAATTGTAVTVYAGDVVAFPAETFGGGAISANYNVAVACAGGSELPSGAVGRSVTIAASATATTCTYTNTPILKTVALRKQWSGARLGDDASITISRAGSVFGTFDSNADAANEIDTDPIAADVLVGETVRLAETLVASNSGLYDSALTCTGAADTDPADGLTIAAGDGVIVCTFTNTQRTTDLSITKTNTPANGASDQTADTVVGGTDTTYSVVVTNHAATAVIGAVVRDTPQAGLDCSAANAVTCAGAACPPGAITVGDLANGVTLGQLAAGATATLSFACAVQR